MPYPSTTIAQKDTNSEGTVALSAALSWVATDNLTLTPSLFYQRQQVDDQSIFWTNLSNPGEGKFVNGAVVAQPTMDRFILPSLKVKWDLGVATVYSNTSYMDRKRDATDDYSVFITELLTGNYVGRTRRHRFISTIRRNNSRKNYAFNPPIPPVDCTGYSARFYQRVNQKADETVVAPGLGDVTQALFGLTVPQVFGFDSLPGGIIYVGHDSTTDTQLAGFGQVDFKFTDTLTATAGIRVAHSKFTYSNFQDGPFNSGPSGSSGGDRRTTIPRSSAWTISRPTI